MTATAQNPGKLPEGAPASPATAAARRILVVDDPETQAFFRKIFPAATERFSQEDSLYEVDSAGTGDEALERVRGAVADGQPYAMVFVGPLPAAGRNVFETSAGILETDPDAHVILCGGVDGSLPGKIGVKLERSDRFVILKKPFAALEIKQLVTMLAGKWELVRSYRESNHRWHESEQCHLFVADELETRVIDKTAELVSTRLRLEHLLRSSPSVIYSLKVTNPPAFTFVSDNFATLFGHQPDELKASPEFWVRHLHPDDRALVAASRARRFQAGHLAVDFRFRHKDGTYRWVHDNARVIRDRLGTPVEIIGSLSDITERKRVEDAWRAGEKRYRTLIETQGEGVVITDEGLRFLFANQAAAELFQTPAESLIGKYVHDFLDEENHDRIKREVSRRKAGEKSTYELDINLPGGEVRHVIITATPQLNDEGEFYGSLAIFRDITERRKAEEKLRLQTTALEAAANGIVITDRKGLIVWVNPAFTQLTGYAASEVIGRNPSLLKSGAHDVKFYREMWQTISSGKAWHGELVNRRKDGSEYFEEMTITPLVDGRGQVVNFVAVKQDVSQRKGSEKEFQMLDMQLRQAQKLEAIGQLASGIAHEINTPIQYVGDNTRFVKDAFADVRKILVSHRELLGAAKTNAITPAALASAEKLLEAAEVDYLFEQVPSAINETLEGVERVTKIVRAMKEFSHPGGKEKSMADINNAIESTTTVARNEWKYVSDLKLDLNRDLPSVPCFLGEFNQVILNLVINAAHTIGDVVKEHPGTKGTITVSTRRDGGFAEVRVSDTGTGIPEKNRAHIFEPYFTTKAMGKGTGQGLSLVYGSVVKKHGGTVTFETEVGKGTTFIVRLPLAPNS